MADTIFGVSIDALLLFIFILVLTVILARLAYVLLRRAFDDRFSRRRSKVLARSAQYVVIMIGIGWGLLEVLRLNLTVAAASLGVVGIGVAFASQTIIQNWMAGVLIGLERRVQLEDWIEVYGMTVGRPARVRDITLTRTVLLTSNGRLIYVPNAYLISNLVTNYSKAGFVEVPLDLQVPAAEDLGRVKRIILEVADKEPKVLPNVAPSEKDAFGRMLSVTRLGKLFENRPPVELFSPRVLVTGTTGATVLLSVRIWIMEVGIRDEIVSSYWEHLLARLKEERINLTCPAG
jgi:small conductance mechanosensitive channel